MHKKDERTFEERLEVGNKKEKELVDILNWCGVPSKLNNSEIVTDIDIELISDKMFVDCKLVETPFYKSLEYVNIPSDKCLPVSIRHIKAYDEKEKNTGKKCWIAFFVNFVEFEIRDLIFVPNSQLVHMIDNELVKPHNGKISFNKDIGRDMHEFLNYLKQLRKIKGM